MIKDFFVLAVRNLRKRGLRSWLTMLGIFISVATIFTLVSLSLGLQAAVEDQFESLGADKIFIYPGTGLMSLSGSSNSETILTEDDVDLIEKIRGVKDISFMAVSSVKAEYRDEVSYLYSVGIPSEHIDMFTSMSGYGTETGRWLERRDSYSVDIGWLIGEGNVFGESVELGDKVEINGIDFKVVGVIEQVGNSDDDSSIYLPLETFREATNISERVDTIIVQVAEGEDVNEVADRIEKKLRNFRDVDEDTQDFIISTPEEILESFQNILGIITIFLGGVAGISLLVGAIGIANTMYTSVIERTKEIGVMKAVGAQNKDVLTIFLIESGLLGSVGAGIGIVLGYLISKGVEIIAVYGFNTTLLKAATPMYLIFGCLIFGFVIGALSGVFPALQASKTNVVEALRYE